MGISHKSRDKKSDKETQSPVLKLFKDMIQREKHDPEKTNLLKSKTEKKKKKHSGSRCKSEHKTVDTSCSGRRNAPYTGTKELRNAEYDIRTHSVPFQGEKRESWWFWGDASPEKPPSDDTCSCVSCALKKIINTDYACIGCLVLLFTISVIVAFLLVYKSIPCLSDKTGSKKETDRPKRKIDGLSKLNWDHLGKEGRRWDNEESGYGVSRSMDFQDLSSLVDADSDLFKILDNDVMNEIQSSERLKEFYKKLIETDAQIRNLKKNNEASINNIDFEDKYKTYPERVKRSLKNLQKPWKLFYFKKNKKDKGNKVVDRKEKITADKDKMDEKNLSNNDENKVPTNLVKGCKQKHQKANRSKRFDNASKPEGFLIEDKKILIQYKPNYNRKSKCSHAPKDSKSHEKQLKHPFYQNTQRIDELLDKFLDRNFPEIMANQLGLDLVFQKNKNKCKHPKIEVDALNRDNTSEKTLTKVKSITQTKIESKVTGKGFGIDDGFTNAYGTETSTVRNVMFDDLEFGDGDRKREDTTTNNYGLLMSISTMMYSEVPNARKLLQTDADDDMNEVMVKSDGQDEVNKDNRNKRMNGLTLKDMKNIVKSNFALSPNWKGPMPLYPDELNSMVKQVPVIANKAETPVLSKYNLETDKKPVAVNKAKDSELNSASEIEENIVNKVEIPVSKDSPSEIDEFEVDLNDMEYIEDYFRDKYDRLVEMAQAYSDYGVLDGKKMATEKKVDDKVKLEVPDRSIKFTFSGFKEGFKNNLFGRPKKGNLEKDVPSEGFRLEYQPTPTSGDDMPVDLYKEIKKHLKVASTFKTESKPDPSQIDSNIDFIYTPITNEPKTTTNTIPEGNGIFFSIGKKRTLKSVEISDKISETTPDDNLKDDAVNPKENGLKSVFKFKREVSNNLLTDDNNVTSDAMKLGVVDEFVNCTVKVDAKELDSTTIKSGQDGISSNTTTGSSDANNTNLSDFFMTLASWFSALDGVDFNFDRNILRNSSSSLPNNTEAKVTNKTVDIIYPEYDSDMIENIGHRSRVLLSVEDVNATVKIEHSDGKDKGITEAVTHTDPKTIILKTNKPKATNITENKTKSIVKRNAESNLIFWNDLYDDEYGVAVDHFESNVRDKHSITKSDLMKIPQEWFRNKVRKIADGIHRKAESLRKTGKTGAGLKTGKAKNVKEQGTIKGETKQINKRVSRTAIEDDLSPNKKTDFAALTANMKKICRKAAKDIELAKRVDVREVSKDGQVTSSLMQQLVRLMGDLVDFQVKQRTCRKLPQDLQEFLDWLMSSSTESDADKYSSYKTGDFHDVGKVSDKSDSLGIFSERDTPDSRSDCLGTLQAVQALMQQYEEMGEDDKSKMSGVKEYLENQMQYLQKRIPTSQDLGLYNTDSIRFRREVSTDETPKKHKKRCKLGKIIKNLIRKIGKKHTNNNSSDVNNNNDKVENKDVKTVKDKRNLRDVYFKALADAKKLTTVKGIFSHT